MHAPPDISTRPSRPASLLWELVGDGRLMLVLPDSMVVQVAHRRA